jgi:hypothetical protein
MNPIRTPKLPLPPPLSGSIEPSFAHLTVTRRMPRIARETLAENNFLPEIVARFETLISEIPAQAIRPLQDPGAPDLAEWDAYVEPYQFANWLEIPWFFAEEYFYRRILEASGYFQPGETWQLDPYASQKRTILQTSQSAIISLGEILDQVFTAQSQDRKTQLDMLYRLLLRSAWGNQGDLSVWSVTEERPDHDQIELQEAHLLSNQAAELAEFILLGKPLSRVDLILDNCGPELIADLGLVDYLLSAGLAQAVRLQAKAHPTFVSDALIKNIHQTIEYFSSLPDIHAQAWAHRLTGHIAHGRLQLTRDFFWNSPVAFWEMPERIRQEMSTPSLVISKGDANYRRLVGDLCWDPATPFADVVGYFPAPLATLRVLKAEVVVGLPPGKAAEIEQVDSNWMLNGEWGVIQFMPLSTA